MIKLELSHANLGTLSFASHLRLNFPCAYCTFKQSQHAVAFLETAPARSATMLLCKPQFTTATPTSSRLIAYSSLSLLQQHAHNLHPQTSRTRSLGPSSCREEPLRVSHMSLPNDPRPPLLRAQEHGDQGRRGCPGWSRQLEERRQNRGYVYVQRDAEEDEETCLHATAKCPREGCECRMAYFRQVQIRSADEPSTSFYKCVECATEWREN
jgi:DNA-directed RNA polymerase subunit M/transcription elongation factor TFIIS